MEKFSERLTVEEINQMSKGSGEVETLTPEEAQERLQALQDLENGK